MARPRYRDDPLLTNLGRQAAIARFEAIEAELGTAAAFLDDAGEIRAAAMLHSARRDLLACCWLIRPPDQHELAAVIEQRTAG